MIGGRGVMACSYRRVGIPLGDYCRGIYLEGYWEGTAPLRPC